MSMAASIYGPFYLEVRAFRWLAAVGRLAPGATLEMVNQELATLTERLAAEYPDTNVENRAHASLLANTVFGEARGNLLMLWGASGLVLLVACTNVAALLLIRLVTRSAEIAVRIALGAGRPRLLGELLAEAVVLTTAGAIVGVTAATGVHEVARAQLLQGFPSFVEMRLGGAVMAVMLLVTLGCAATCAAVPAWALSRRPVRDWLGQRGSAASGGRRTSTQKLLVVAEVTMAVVLGVGAMATFTGFVELMTTDLGFRTEGLLTARMDVQDERFDAGDAYIALVDGLAEGLRALPGVSAAALVGPKMPTDDWNSATVTVETRQAEGLDAMGIDMVVHRITPGFLPVAGIPLLDGRAFDPGDRGGAGAAPVILVSATTAERMWPGSRAVGQRLKLGGPASNAPWMEVVGVVGDAAFAGLGPPPPLDMDLDLPLLQWPARTPPILNLMVRTEQPPDALIPGVRALARELAPASPVFDVRTMSDRIRDQSAARRTVVILMSTFAVLSLLLAAIGIYAVTAYDVTQRRREFGIRMALGATRSTLQRLVLGSTVRLALLGATLGLLVATIASRAAASWLPGLAALGPRTYILAVLGVLVLTLAATLAPALRASRSDPARTLRNG
jgi:predicted permease